MRCEIRVEGVLDARWSTWFDGLEIRTEGEDVTVIAGWVADQAALHGLLTRVHDLGLSLISVRRTDERRVPDSEYSWNVGVRRAGARLARRHTGGRESLSE